MGGIQSAIDRKKQERSTERMKESGIDPGKYAREDLAVPDFPTGGEATIFFQRVPKAYIEKHADDKFRVFGRNRLSFRERIDLPANSPDSTRTLGAGEGFQLAKKLVKSVVKGKKDEVVDQLDIMLKRGGRVFATAGRGRRLG